MQNVYSSVNASGIDAIWNKGAVLPNSDPAVWRRDAFGAVIRRDHYGQRGKKYGWEVDHVVPVSNGGSNALSNLRPLYFQNNCARNADGPPWYFYKYNPSTQSNDLMFKSLQN